MEFKQLRKLVSNLKARQARVKVANKAFKKLTKAQQRVAIAKDALQQLNAKKYTASPGTWCNTNLPAKLNEELVELDSWNGELTDGALEVKTELRTVYQDNDENVLQPLLQEPGVRCDVCALGSLFASAVRKADGCTLDVLDGVASYGDTKHETDHDDIVSALDQYFTNSQQRLMEIAFEEGGGAAKPATPQEYAAADMYVGKNPTQRLRAILNNIIANNGVFKVANK